MGSYAYMRPLVFAVEACNFRVGTASVKAVAVMWARVARTPAGWYIPASLTKGS